jgi:mannosyl-3-phosphoglycerate synthase
MEIETLCVPHLLEAERLAELDYFVRHTAFVVCHKAEPLDTLLAVLRYIPAESPLIVVTNCAGCERAPLFEALAGELGRRPAAYLAHQKDVRLAQFFRHAGVARLLGADGLVVDGKGEGMYLGALLAALARSAEWLVYYDADNHAPSALLEYTLAMARLFMAGRTVPLGAAEHPGGRAGPVGAREHPGAAAAPAAPAALHNVRVCWASKPDYDGREFAPQPGVAGRCTRVVAPLCDRLARARWPATERAVLAPNAGEQGMTLGTALALRFSSGYSVETFQLLELLFAGERGGGPRARLQQYTSGSPHFHQKKDDEHIRGMIAASLGSFLHFRRRLPAGLLERLGEVAAACGIAPVRPVVYPPLGRLPLAGHEGLAEQFRLGVSEETASA